MQLDSLKLLYSSKTDDELLALAADEASLLEEAKPILADELQRRNLAEHPTSESAEWRAIPVPQSAWRTRYLPRAKWLGLWLWNTLIATAGVATTIGFFTYSSQPFVSRAARMHFTQTFVWTPYYPVPILAGLVIGFLIRTRFRGSYRYYAWILPSAVVLGSLLDWRASNQASWWQAAAHFFGRQPYPDNRDQLDTSFWLYMSLAYSLGAWFRTFVKRFSPPRSAS
jgi:hypothetical protein